MPCVSPSVAGLVAGVCRRSEIGRYNVCAGNRLTIAMDLEWSRASCWRIVALRPRAADIVAYPLIIERIRGGRHVRVAWAARQGVLFRKKALSDRVRQAPRGHNLIVEGILLDVS